MPRLRRRIAQAGALALATAAFTGPAITAEEPADTLGLRLTRLAGGEPAAAFSVATPDGRALALGDLGGAGLGCRLE